MDVPQIGHWEACTRFSAFGTLCMPHSITNLQWVLSQMTSPFYVRVRDTKWIYGFKTH